MSRKRIIDKDEEWVVKTFSLTPKEAIEYDRLRGDRNNIEFFRLLLQAYKLRRKDYEMRIIKQNA